jgi:hypothetical protein
MIKTEEESTFKNNDYCEVIYNDDQPFVTLKSKNNNCFNSLEEWMKQNAEFIKKEISVYGGIFLQGFNINSPKEFDSIAKIVEPNLCKTHDFDDSARMWFTKNIYQAFPVSITKDDFSVDYHNEDGFMPYVPSTIMLCSISPADFGGESIFSDCRKVFQTLPNELKEKFIKNNIKNSFSLPDSVFLTNSRIPKNKEEIAKLAKKYGATEVYRIDDSTTRFTFETPSVIQDSLKAPVWFGRAHQADILPKIIDIWHSYNFRKNIFSTLKSYYLILKTIFEHFWNSLSLLWISDKNKIVYSYDNGKKISLLDQIKIRQAHWKNSTILSLEKGDAIILDNRLVTHGRMPYKGRRELLSCIGSQAMVKKYQKNL